VTQQPVRVAIAGAGMVARVHLDAARRAGARVVGISASTPERGKLAAAGLGVERAFESSEELAVSDEVDVVHICTPNAQHRPLAELALRAGKHVVCEKPLATSAADAAALTALAAARGVVAAVPFVYRYHPMAAEARARVTSGALGPVHLLHGHYLQDWLTDPADSNWRVDPVAGGPSRAFADIGSHWCDLAEWITGHRISELVAVTATVHGERGTARAETFAAPGANPGPAEAVSTEDAAHLLFRTDRGATGSLLVSQVSPGRKNRLWLEVDAADASVTFDQENPEALLLGRRGGIEALSRDAALLSPAAARLSTLPPGHNLGYYDCFAAFVRDVHAAVRGDATAAFPTFADAARTAALTDAVLTSARTRSWTEVPAA
jgi:predicted dehydrogenase